MQKKIKMFVAVMLAAIFSIFSFSAVAATYQGIDIACYAYSVDYSALKDSGHSQFIIIKTSEGITLVDPKWRQFTDGAKAAGIPFGFYHFFHSDDDGAEEAQIYWNLIKDSGYTVIPAVDVEVTDGNSAAVIQRELRKFVDKFYELSGQKPLIYSYTSFINNYIGNGFTDCKLWQAHYGVASPRCVTGWGGNYTAWQYKGSTHILGIGNDADLDTADDGIFVDGKYPDTSSQSTPQQLSTGLTHSVGEHVTFSYCFSASSDAADKAIPVSKMFIKQGTITSIAQGRSNPYLIDNGICWVNDSAINGEAAPATAAEPSTKTASTTVHSVGDEVTFTTCFSSSTDSANKAIPASKMYIKHGKITKILSGRNNPYLIDNGVCWVNDSAISGASSATQSAGTGAGITTGSIVSIRSGAVYGGLSSDRGRSVPGYALRGKYTIEQFATHRGVKEALLSGINSWIGVSKLYRR